MKAAFLSKIKKIPATTIIFGLITVLAFFLRFYQLDTTTPLTFDQGRDLQKLAEITQGNIALIGPTTGLEGVYLGPLYFYVLIPGFIFSHGHPLGVMYWLSFLVTLSLSLCYLVLKKVVPTKWALLGYFLLTITPGALEDARLIWNPSIVLLFLMPSLWLLLESKTKPYLLSSSLLFFGLSLQTEMAYVIFFALIYLWWVIHLYRSQADSIKKPLIIGLILFGLTLVPQILFELTHNFLMTKAAISHLTNPLEKASLFSIWMHRPHQMSDAIIQRLWANHPLSIYFFLTLILSTAYFSWQKITSARRLLLYCFITTPLLLLLYVGNFGNFFPYYLHPHYFFGLAVLLLFISSIKTRLVRWSATILLLSVSISSFAYATNYLYKPENLDYTFQKELAALEYPQQVLGEKTWSVEIFTPNLKPDQYYYLIDWLSRQDVSISKAEGNTQPKYLLYEPAISDGSQVALQQWYDRSSQNMNCQYLTTVGITSIRKCDPH